ncbi:MAG: hypothetical protein IMF09_06560 [Proteobacteria bacterium]|nr:hypothetical protein [Pseudomonadota bacterium]
MLNVTIKSATFTRPLLVIIILLLAGHLLGLMAVLEYGVDHTNYWINVLNLDKEAGIPTLVVIIEWLLCVTMLLLIAGVRKKQHKSWFMWGLLALLFLFLTIDESISIHEYLALGLHYRLNTSGLLYFAWVIPYGLVFAVLCFAYLRFFLGLSIRVKRQFILAAVLFVGGALGIELLEGRYFALYGRDVFYHLVYVSIEETMEMLGLLVFFRALIIQLQEETDGFHIHWGQ